MEPVTLVIHWRNFNQYFSYKTIELAMHAVKEWEPSRRSRFTVSEKDSNGLSLAVVIGEKYFTETTYIVDHRNGIPKN